MELNMGYNSLKVEETGSKTNVPDHSLARLMYYLDCALAVIQYEEDNKLTDYKNYFRLTEDEEKAVYTLAVLFNPKIFIDAGVFILSDYLVPYGSSNQFYKITDDRIGIHVNQEIMIGGRVVRVLKVMALKSDWLNRNYFEPLERMSYKFSQPQTRYRPLSEKKYCCCFSSRKKCCCCFWLSFIGLSIFLTLISNLTS